MVTLDFTLESGTRTAQSLAPMALVSEPSIIPGIVMSDLSLIEQGTQKRSVVGIFDQFSFPQFPVQIARFWITAWVANVSGSVTALDLTTRIEEKGTAHVVFSNSIRHDFGKQHVLDPTAIVALNTPITGIIFQKPGLYSIVLLLNGNPVGERDFHVKLISQLKTEI